MKLFKTKRANSKDVGVQKKRGLSKTPPPRIKTPSFPRLLSEEVELQAIAPWLTKIDVESPQTPPAGQSKAVETVKLHRPTPSFPLPLETVPSKDSKRVFGITAASKSESRPPAEPVFYIRFLVGKQAAGSRYLTTQCFLLPIHHLHDSTMLSKYAKYALEHRSTNPITFRLPELDPNAFALYCEYLTTGRIGTRKQDKLHGYDAKKCPWTACWPLINAQILATTIGDARFASFIMGMLTAKLDSKQKLDVETVNHVFTTVDVSKELKLFIVDEALMNSPIQISFSPGRLAAYPTSFLRTALHRTTQMLAGMNEPKASNSHAVGGAVYQVSRYSPNNNVYDLDENTAAVTKLREILAQEVKKREEAHDIQVELQTAGVIAIDWAVERKTRARKRPRISSRQGPTSNPEKRTVSEATNDKQTKDTVETFPMPAKKPVKLRIDTSKANGSLQALLEKDEEKSNSNSKPELMKIAKEIHKLRAKGTTEDAQLSKEMKDRKIVLKNAPVEAMESRDLIGSAKEPVKHQATVTALPIGSDKEQRKATPVIVSADTPPQRHIKTAAESDEVSESVQATAVMAATIVDSSPPSNLKVSDEANTTMPLEEEDRPSVESTVRMTSPGERCGLERPVSCMRHVPGAYPESVWEVW